MSDRARILIVDDEEAILETMTFTFEDDYDVLTAPSAPEALSVLDSNAPIAVVITDQRMPEMTGVEFLARVCERHPNTTRIILTGYTDHEALVQAVNGGQIYRYVTKPWNTKELRLTLQRGVEMFHLARENARLVEELRQANERLTAENTFLRQAAPPAEIVGESPEIREVLALVARVAPSRTTVLIEGETGSGKELVARAIHTGGLRRDRLFVPVNCAAVSEGLLESELFGHRRGAFTGALSDRKGLFEVAGGGTLFLDEISETSPALQAKLLRVLEDGEVRPVGETRSRRVDVRVIAATPSMLPRALVDVFGVGSTDRVIRVRVERER